MNVLQMFSLSARLQTDTEDCTAGLDNYDKDKPKLPMRQRSEGRNLVNGRRNSIEPKGPRDKV